MVPVSRIPLLSGAGLVALDRTTYIHGGFPKRLARGLARPLDVMRWAPLSVELRDRIGANAKKARAGSMQSAKSGAILSLAILCASTPTVLLALFQAALVP